jgi:hypothetical protein
MKPAPTRALRAASRYMDTHCAAAARTDQLEPIAPSSLKAAEHRRLRCDPDVIRILMRI